jgi:hypothetical protein
MGEMKAELIAPCGMNCRLCLAYQRQKKHCPGCRGDDASKSVSCRQCLIKNCSIVQSSHSGFCYECERYPCLRLRQLDKRYRTKYRMSMLENLKTIKDEGLDIFLQREEERWRCPNCGAVLSVHRLPCPVCKIPENNSADSAQ